MRLWCDRDQQFITFKEAETRVHCGGCTHEEIKKNEQKRKEQNDLVLPPGTQTPFRGGNEV